MTIEEKSAGTRHHPLKGKPDERILAALPRRLHDGKLPCVRAFEIARELSVSPIEVGYAADVQKIRISQCQLGLFGYEPEKRIVQPAVSVAADLEDAISEALDNGRLPCRRAFAIAKERRIPKIDVCAACEKLSIKICSCQLGAFS